MITAVSVIQSHPSLYIVTEIFLFQYFFPPPSPGNSLHPHFQLVTSLKNWKKKISTEFHYMTFLPIYAAIFNAFSSFSRWTSMLLSKTHLLTAISSAKIRVMGPEILLFFLYILSFLFSSKPFPSVYRPAVTSFISKNTPLNLPCVFYCAVSLLHFHLAKMIWVIYTCYPLFLLFLCKPNPVRLMPPCTSRAVNCSALFLNFLLALAV